MQYSGSRRRKRLQLFMLAIAAVVALIVTGTALWWGSAQRSQDPETTSNAGSPTGDELLERYKAEEKAEEKARQEARLIRLEQPEGRPLEIFLAADSLGAGYHATTLGDAYRSRVQAALESRGMNVNMTLATKPADAPLFQVTTIETVPEGDIDLAIIELGTNDAGRTEPKKFRTEYLDLIDQIRAQNPKTPILCLGVWGQPNDLRKAIDNEIRRACLENDGRYISLASTYTRNDTWGPKGRETWIGPSDNFHPNDLGHKEIADLIIDRLPAN